MARELDAETEAAAAASVVRPYLLVQLDYESGPVRVASTPFPVQYLGQEYLGVGRLGSISAMQEGAEVRSYGISLQLSGIPLAYFQDVVSERAQDRACRVWLGFLDSGHRPIGSPVQVFGGRVDVTVIELGSTVTVTVSAESRLVDWERARIRRYTHQDQQRAYPGDRGLEYVQATTDMELVWGRG